MKDDMQTLIDSLRRGQYEDPTEKISLLSAALQEQNAELQLLLSLIRAPQIPLRLAAIDASRDRNEPELLAELLALVDHPEVRIRLKLVDVLRLKTDELSVEALRELATDMESDVRDAAIKNTAGRAEFQSIQEACLANDPDWRVRLTAANCLGGQKNPEVINALFKALQHDDDGDVGRRCAEIIEQCLRESPEARQNADAGIIRHYDVGIAPKVKDTRTGRVTTRVKQIFKGDLGPLLDFGYDRK
jgi:hypothetical protein